MEPDENEEKLLHSVALRNATSILLARQRAEEELIRAKEALERKTKELAHTLAMMRSTMESTTDAILVTDECGRVTDFNQKFVEMWRLPHVVIESREHRQLLEVTGREFKEPEKFRSRIEEIYVCSPPESFDLLELADGRVLERFSKIQFLDERNVGRVWSFRDITQRKRAEEELRQEREWCQVTLSSIGDAVIATDTHGKITYLNPVAETMTGWKSEEASGQHLEKVFNIIHEDTRQLATNPVRTVLREGIIVGLANHTALIAKDGTETAIEDSAAPIKDALGRISGAVMVFYDVTERRRAEQAVRQGAQRLQLALSAGGLGDWSWDAATDLLTLGSRASDIFGLRAGTPATWAALRELLHEEDRERARLAVEQALADRSDYSIEYRLNQPSGEPRWILANGRGVYAKDGATLGMIGVVQDITERKLLEKVHFRLAALVESSEDAIVSKTLEGIISTWNKGAEQMFGYAANEVIGKPITILIPPHQVDEEASILGRLKRGERIEHYETVRMRKDGTMLNVSLTVSPIKDAHGRIIGASKIARDITDRIRAEEALRDAQDRLSRHAEDLEIQVAERTATLRETIGELEAFSYSISHDMRAPLRAMQSFATILEDECASQISPEGKEYIRRINTAAERMDRLIQDVLTYSRTARTELPLERVDVEKLLRDILESHPEFHAAADIQWEGSFPPIVGIEAVLTQCVSNLLDNAIKFVAPGVIPRVRVWAETVGNGKMVRLFFKDNGLGIDKEAYQTIFDIFQRISKNYDGTGIGLAIVKKGLERMGGSVGLESEPGHGSTFWLELRRANDRTE